MRLLQSVSVRAIGSGGLLSGPDFLVLSSEGENMLYGDGKERTYCMGMLQGLYCCIPY